MADKRISQLIERVDIANNDVLPIVASGATTTNKVTVSTLQDWMQDNLDVGVTSVGLSMPSAFVVSNSPVTGSGNISVTGAGTVSQYIRGDGSLADFPSGGGGGGSSVNYYLNGSVSQGTIGGIAYKEMNKVPVLGAGTDFVAIADGYLASFITDAGDPALLEIPAGNWNFETYFSASSGGGTPSFYVELYKVDIGGTATLIASNSGTPELIAFGTTITPYFSTLAVPTTSLTLTDRLALRYYVARSGRTITLHTENSHLCQIITTFTTGLTALNSLTAQVQNFATGTSGTNFGISSTGSTHTFNLPTASATNRGALSSADWSSFNGKVPYTGAVANVDLGVYSITASEIIANGSGSNSGIIHLESNAIHSLVNGYGSIASGTTNQFNLYQTTGAGVFRGAILSLNGITASATRTFTLPDLDGTLALTSQIPANIVTGTGGQGRVAYWDSTGVIKSDPVFQYNDFSKRVGIGRTPTVSLDVEGAGYFSGALGVGGALSGTSASFSGNIQLGTIGGGSSTLTPNSINLTSTFSNTAGINLKLKLFEDTGGNIYGLGVSNGQMDFNVPSGASYRFYTGAATFSSSVTTGAAINLPNNFSLTGRNAANTLNISLISRNTSDRVVIDADGYGTNIGGGGTVLINPTGGNVGIGTAVPVSISGYTALTLNNATTGGILTFQKNGSNIGSIYNDASNIYFGVNSGSAIFETSGAERVRITSGGFTKARANGGSYFGGGYHEFVNNSNVSGSITLVIGNVAGSNTNNAASIHLVVADTAGDRLYIYGNGNVVNLNNSYGSLSDIKLKENIEDATPKLDDLMKVKVRNYNLIGEETKQIGVIAQELEEVFPAMIDESPDYEEVEVPQLDEEGNEVLNEEGEVVTEKQKVSKGTSTKSVKYSVFVPMLIKAMQEQQEQIQELKTEIDSLKNQIK